MFETRRCRATSPTVRKLPEKLSRGSDSDRAFIWIINYTKHPKASDQGFRDIGSARQAVLDQSPGGFVEARRPVVVQRHDLHVAALGRGNRQGMVVDVHDRDRWDLAFDSGPCESVIAEHQIRPGSC